ncbi:hypothetical protein EYF80_007794 [Liparis tanakae]|uniref:Uncharacterized protein n=1 Tax=Liparis tanakae TaxID=230148 RepID=A0A4Z2IVH0_9TELE|nr:hypothetical protein EYF80_007794 [Liparis tanakae]
MDGGLCSYLRNTILRPVSMRGTGYLLIKVAPEPEAVGSAGRVPLPGGLSPKHQDEMEEEEGGHQQEAHNACVGDEGKCKSSIGHTGKYHGYIPETSIIQGMISSRTLCIVTPSFNMTMKTSAFIRVAYSSPDHINNKQLRKYR